MKDHEKPGLSKEDDYFARIEFERKKKIADEKESHMRAKEKEDLKQLHWMHCPKDGVELVEMVYMGVHVDKCTHCGGIFLDAGELERLVEEGKKQDNVLTKILGVFS
jgi:uncharacterized protein